MNQLVHVFVVWANLTNGSQVEIARSGPIEESTCLEMQQEIWNTEFPIVAFTEKEPLPSVDAACIPLGLLKD